MSFATILFLLSFMAVPFAALADLDAAGNIIGGGLGPGFPPGALCGSCPEPASGDAGVAFKDGDMWVLSQAGQIYHMQSCGVVGVVSIDPSVLLPFGLGYDSNRGLFIVSDPLSDRVFQIDLSGLVVQSWPSPGPGPVGAAYDASRDLYWISDWDLGELNSVDPNTGLAGPTIAAPAGTRLAGTGYDPHADALVYHGRDEAQGYWVSVQTGLLVNSYPVPMGGLNNGQGAGVDPATNNVWLSHFEEPTVFCVEGLGGPSTGSDNATWGSVKVLFR